MCYLLLGSNLGDRIAQLHQALQLLTFFAGDVLKKSSVYETAAWGKTNQPNFYNQVIQLETDQNAEELLLSIQQIEEKLGRERHEKWGERGIDIDILYFENQVVSTSDLKIPHPEIPNRRFTLIPLVEIAPTYIHPILKKTNTDLLKICKDNLKVSKI